MGKGQDLEASALGEALPSGTVVSLSFTGKGVLVKRIPQAKAEQPDTLVQELLPGAKAADYYVDTAPASLGQVVVAIVRRSVVDAVLGELRAKGLAVLDMHIGPLACLPMAHLMALEGEERLLYVSGYGIKLNPDGLPEQIERVDTPFGASYVVAGETLVAEEVLPFTSALGFWLAPAETFAAKDATGGAYSEHLQKQLFSNGVKAVLGVFFVALLLNFALFNQQYQLNTELAQLAGNKQERLQQYEALKKTYDQNLAFLSGEGWLNPAKVSYYADGIAATIPNEIVLTQMVVYPDTAIRKTSLARSRFDTHGIRLSGQVNSSVLLQQWATGLRDIPWVRTVTVKNYSQENPKAPGIFDVILELKP